MTKYKLGLIWILVPFVYGIIVNTFQLNIPLLLSQIVFGVFWFWVGLRFAKIDGSRVKNFFIGISIWLLSFIAFFLRVAFIPGESSNAFATIGQHYMESFLWSGTQLSKVFTGVPHGLSNILLAYFVMLLVFTIGFELGNNKGKLVDKD